MSKFRHKRISATISQSGPAGTLVTLSLNNELIALLSEPEARSLGVFLTGVLVKEERKITQETATLHEEIINSMMCVNVDKADGMTMIAVRGEGDLVLSGNEARALCDVLTKHLPRDVEESEASNEKR